MTHFGRWLDIWIKETYGTHKKAGVALGIQPNVIGRWTRGENLPSLPQCETLARAGFNVQGALLDTGPASYSAADTNIQQQIASSRYVHKRVVELVKLSTVLSDGLEQLASEINN